MKKVAVFILIAVCSSLGAFLLYRQGFPPLQQVDLRLKDIRFLVRGKQVPDPRVVVCAIDGRSIKEIGRWPWSREVTADLLAGLKQYGTKVVALDVVFSEPQGAAQDQALARSISQGNTILGYFFRNDDTGAPVAVPEGVRQSRIKLLHMEDGASNVPLSAFRGIDASIPVVSAAAADQGFFNIDPDDDGVYRSIPLLALMEGDIYPSLALSALASYLDAEPQVSVATFGIRSIRIGKTELPVNEGGELALNFYGPGGTFRSVSAADVIKRRLPPSSLRDALVVVGATEMGIYDLRPTPFDPAHPGVEIHATVATNALENRFLTRDSRTAAIELAAIFLLPILLGLLLNAASHTPAGLGWFTLCSFSWLFLNHFLFRTYVMDLSIVYPVMPLLVTYLGGEAYRNLVVERSGRYLKKAFSTYISPDLVKEIVKHPERLKLGGEKRQVSILFSDIRGFTTLSESLQAEELVRLLNEYLSPMTRIILDQQGTVDKFIGDAVMAIFNAPLDIADHAACACRAAVQMTERLRELNESFAGRGMPRIDIGIGINTGEAVVGNMGTEQRFDYTAIGDNVNLASRLEGLTKQYGARIVVSAATKEAAGDKFHFREIGSVRVKGKYKPVVIYELMVEGFDFIEPFTKALELYRARNFKTAMELFKQLGDQGDQASALYVSRCEEYIGTPPDSDWDGVYVARSK